MGMPAVPVNGYDEKIIRTSPSYEMFHKAVVDLVSSRMLPEKWLDTGCGTGTMYVKAKDMFPNVRFTLADPSEDMLEIAKRRSDGNAAYILSDTQDLDEKEGSFDVVSAILCHHYLNMKERERATRNCFRMLRQGGVYVTFENILRSTPEETKIAEDEWRQFLIRNGRTAQEAEDHLSRRGKEFFPLTPEDHIKLLKAAGFCNVGVLWTSYMQGGFYAIK